MVACAVVEPGPGKIDEYGFAVARLGCQLLPVAVFDLAGVDHPQRITEIPV